MKVKRSIDGTDGISFSVARPYNSYNIFFALERVRFIEARRNELGLEEVAKDSNHVAQSYKELSILACSGYDNLELPPLPQRYAHLGGVLPANWYVPGKNTMSKRKHAKSHGSEFMVQRPFHLATLGFLH